MLPTSKGSGCSPLPDAQTSLDPFSTLDRALLRSPGHYEPMGCLCIYVLVCLFVCVFVCVSVSACVSLTSYACLYLSLCMFLCLLMCFHVSVCLSVSLWVVYMSVWLCVWGFIFVCLPVFMYNSRSITWADPQKERLPVHVYTPVTWVDQWYPVEHSLVVGFINPTKYHHTVFHPACVETREWGILGGE